MGIKDIRRFADSNLLEKVNSNNLTVVVGPGSVGKSQFVQRVLPGWKYVSLANPYNRMNAFNDPEEYLEWLGDEVIIDDIQYGVRMTDFICEKYVAGKLNQKIVLVCDVQIESLMCLVEKIIPVTWLSNRELINSGIIIPSANPWIVKGGDPSLILGDTNPYNFYTEVIHDAIGSLQMLRKINKPGNFARLLKMLAARIGTPIITEELSELCEVSIPTVKYWLHILIQHYVINQRNPYPCNYGRRLSKRPVYHFVSSGIAASLLNIRDTEDLEFSPYKQVLFQNSVVNDIMRKYNNYGHILQPYYWNEQNRNVVDLILDTPEGTKGWKVVSNYVVKPMHVRSLERFAKLSGVPTDDLKIVYYGKEVQTIKGFECLPWNEL